MMQDAMNFAMNPPVGAMLQSIKESIPNSNIYLAKNYGHILSFNCGFFIQCIFNIVHFAIVFYYLYLYKGSLIKDYEKNYIIDKNPKAYWSILRKKSRIIGLYYPSKSPFLFKIAYLIEYVSVCMGLNAVFYAEIPFVNIENFVLKSLIPSLVSFGICVGTQTILCIFWGAFEDEKNDDRLKKKLKIYLIISTIYMTLSWAFCAIFCEFKKEYVRSWIINSIIGFCKTFSYRFAFSLLDLLMDKFNIKKIKVEAYPEKESEGQKEIKVE